MKDTRNFENRLERSYSDIEPETKSFTDLYGRNCIISDKEKKRPDKIQSFTWMQDIYQDTDAENQKLSDLLKPVFDYLGPKILIADPCFGSRETDGAGKSLSDSRKALMNAILHSYREKGLEAITVLGFWQKSKMQARNRQKTTENNSYFGNYDLIFKKFIADNDLKISMSFIDANEAFQCRYWFSITERDGVEILDKCLIFNGSLCNMEELDILPVTDESQARQITGKYTGLYKNAKLKLSI
jgi:hypothetical protein